MLSPTMHTTVRVAALEGLGDLASAAGVDYAVLLRQQGIDPLMLNDPDNRLAFAQMVRLLDATAAATRDDCLGLHLGAAQSIHVTGVLGYALRTCPDVRTQIGHVTRYFALHQDGAVMELHVAKDCATLTYTVYDGAVMLHRHDAEATLALAVSQSRVHIGQPHWTPSSVHFEHPAPQAASERELRRFFGCPVHFSEPFNGMRFPPSFLDTPVRTADAGLCQILTRYAEESLARHADATTLSGRVRRLIAAGLSSGNAAIDDVANRMAMTPRTLQRRLTDEGYQFSELVDETRRELATQYLRDTRITLTDAAFLVGYSDLTAFHRAFRRWFNQTPQEYQRQCQA